MVRVKFEELFEVGQFVKEWDRVYNSRLVHVSWSCGNYYFRADNFSDR
jgi:hypothetical protein